MPKKLNYEEVKRYIEIDSFSDCKLLSMNYINSKSKIILKCRCGNEFETTFSEFNSKKSGGKRQCNICGAKKTAEKTSKKQEQFIMEVYDLVKDEYNVLGEYINAETKIKFKHNICNKTFKMKPTNFLIGQRCSYCRGLQKKTTEDLIDTINNKYNNEYIIMEEYQNMLTKILIKHVCCGHIWKVSPHTIQKGILGCPSCKESKGEKEIKKYLSKSNLNYETQYRFDDCKDRYLLPFDVAIFKDDLHIKPICLIEYDGGQHYKPVEYFGGMDTFIKQINRDIIKTNYCIKNNISLIRIPYYKFDYIEEILQIELTKLGLLFENSLHKAS